MITARQEVTRALGELYEKAARIPKGTEGREKLYAAVRQIDSVIDKLDQMNESRSVEWSEVSL